VTSRQKILFGDGKITQYRVAITATFVPDVQTCNLNHESAQR